MKSSRLDTYRCLVLVETKRDRGVLLYGSLHGVSSKTALDRCVCVRGYAMLYLVCILVGRLLCHTRGGRINSMAFVNCASAVHFFDARGGLPKSTSLVLLMILVRGLAAHQNGRTLKSHEVTFAIVS